jgi:hypothetical protein
MLAEDSTGVEGRTGVGIGMEGPTAWASIPFLRLIVLLMIILVFGDLCEMIKADDPTVLQESETADDA